MNVNFISNTISLIGIFHELSELTRVNWIDVTWGE